MNFTKIFKFNQTILINTLRRNLTKSSFKPKHILPNKNADLIKIGRFRAFSVTKYLQTDENEVDDDSYWSSIKDSLESENEVEEETEISTTKKILPKRFTDNLERFTERKVFVLQLKMQFKSKSRQSTTADLQLAESIALVETLNSWKVVDSIILGSKWINSREIFGSGNQELLSRRIPQSGANCLFVVIDRLTSTQAEAIRKNILGNDSNIKIYDRYTIVLEIFKRNARSNIAKLQIALAEIPYIRHKFDNLELYKSVEKKIRKELDDKLKTRKQMNFQRNEKKIPVISVFGYTNVGKTSFIKTITDDSKMQPENKLFATLDITYHGTKLSNSNQNIVFVDTIGFISDIPYTLIESFKTTLMDALHADLYIHLVDLSHPDREAQEKSVVEILTELAPEDKIKNMLTIYNKCDNVENYEKKVGLLDKNSRKYFISCKTGLGIADIKNTIEKFIYKQMDFIELKLKVEQGSEEFAFLNKNSIIKETSEHEDDPQYLAVSVLINKVNALKLIKLYPNVKISK